jgi:hypothetical protein
MEPKMEPKVVQNLVNFGSIFGSLFVEALELFGCLLGAFLGLLRLSWEPLDPKNIEKPMVFKVFGIAEFWLCEPLDGSPGLVLTLLGPIWSQNDPQNGPKSGPTNDQKVIPTTTKQMQIWGPEMGSKM